MENYLSSFEFLLRESDYLSSWRESRIGKVEATRDLVGLYPRCPILIGEVLGRFSASRGVCEITYNHLNPYPVELVMAAKCLAGVKLNLFKGLLAAVRILGDF